MKKKLFFALILIYLTSSNIFSQNLTPKDLRCENMENAVIDVSQPRLTWGFSPAEKGVRQSGYEILIADNEKDINTKKGNVFHVVRKSSNENFIVLDNVKLKSFTRYYWCVRVYDNKNKASKWSEINSFETAVLNPDDWKAKWISEKNLVAKQNDPYEKSIMPVFVKDVKVNKAIKSARLYIAGLGYYEAYLNKAKIGDHKLDPGWTDYSKTVLYATYDVTTQLNQGNNEINIMLGNGWYNLFPLKMWCSKNFRSFLYSGAPCVKAQLKIEYTDNTADCIYTDKNWEVAPGPVLNSDVYLGELYDARKEFNREKSDLTNAVEIEGPSGKLKAQMIPPIKVIKTIAPKSIKEIKDGVYLLDMGQIFSGVLQIKVQGKAGTKVTIRYGEDVYADGSLNGMTSVTGQIKSAGCGGEGSPDVAYQTDSYVLKGEGTEIWSPRFTFRSFRYAEITGLSSQPVIQDFEGLVLSNSVEDAGSFLCSDTLLNKLYDNIRRTFRNNLFSVQSDCPAREKLGYGGDIICTATSFMYNYDMQNLYKKILQDFTDAQRKNGGITETAPFVGIADFSPAQDESGPISYQAIYPFLINELYLFYGDVRIIKDNYSNFRRLMEYLISTSKDDLHEIDISDHEALDEKPEKFSGACFYLYHLDVIRQQAKLLGYKNDELRYSEYFKKTRSAILKKYFDAKTGKFDNNTQTAQVFGLWFPLLDDKSPEKSLALKELLASIRKKDNHLSTGIFGTKMLLDVLRDNDLNDVAYTVVTQPDFPGWLHMVKNGATTLWETWKYSDNVYSQNHPMFGSVMAWFYNSLGGIRPSSEGFNDVIIKPFVNNKLSFVKSAYKSPNGNIVSEWKKEGNRIDLKIEIPANIRAELWIPASKSSVVKLDGKVFTRKKTKKATNDYRVFKVGSGKYNFSVQN